MSTQISPGLRFDMWRHQRHHLEQTIGLDLLVHMARLWRSLSRQHSEGRFRIEESPA